MSKRFSGFKENKEEYTGIPDEFFRELLPKLEDIDELKICLYILWKAYTIGDFGKPISAASIELDTIFMNGLKEASENTNFIESLLDKAVVDDILIMGKNKATNGQKVYFINSPSGRYSASQEDQQLPFANTTLDAIQPNIYKLYQENIGPLTPIIADALRNAEESYSEEWIKEAIQIAVQNNVRRWRYVESILDRWQKEGRNGTDREHDQEDYRRYIKGEYGEIGHH